MNQQEEAQFRHLLLQATAEAKKLGYRPNEFEKMIEREGPFATIKKIVPKKDPSEGFFRLHQLGHTNLTCEAIIVESPWRRFFDADLLAIAEKRLTAFKYKWRPYVGDLERAQGDVPAADSPQPKLKPPQGDADDFIPPDEDHREREMREAYLRTGQAKFREALLKNYKQRCCITGCSVPEALEAAHIAAYRGEGFNHIQNGLLMRGDLHSLFDRYMFSVNPNDLRLVLSTKLNSDSSYSSLEGVCLDIESTSVKPSKRALEIHWSTFKTKTRES
jgi:hypothetical protein